MVYNFLGIPRPTIPIESIARNANQKDKMNHIVPITGAWYNCDGIMLDSIPAGFTWRHPGKITKK